MKLRLLLGVAVAGLALPLTSQAAIKAGDTLLIDFSRNNGSDGQIMPDAGTMNSSAGNNTGVADANGNFWNNAWITNNNVGVAPNSVTNLITKSGKGTGINLSFSTGWEANGFNQGGLKDPARIDPGLLGDVAFANAVGDYFFINKGVRPSGTATMTFSGLNPLLTYDFQIFGTRDTDQIRRTLYSITDVNGTHTYLLQTSGPGIGTDGYNGNNDEFAFLTGIVPDEFGNITLTVSAHTSDYAYIGTLQLTAVPEPGMYGIAAAAGCIALIVARRRRRA